MDNIDKLITVQTELSEKVTKLTTLMEQVVLGENSILVKKDDCMLMQTKVNNLFAVIKFLKWFAIISIPTMATLIAAVIQLYGQVAK